MNLPELLILDVGHGNCAILRDTEAVTIIDCPHSPVLFQTLMQLGIDVIDHVLISHADVDHIGGLIDLLEMYTVRNIYINPDAEKKSRKQSDQMNVDRHWKWRDIRAALNWHSKLGTNIHLALNSALSRRIPSGQ